MSYFKRDHRLDEFGDVEFALRDLRPELPEDRLQRVAKRARAAAISGPSRSVSRKDSFVRSRLSILLMLVFGFALSGTGATLAVSGLTGDAQTSQEGQYGQNTPTTNTPSPTLNPSQGVAGEGAESPAASPERGSAPRETEGAAAPAAAAPEVQVNRQLATQQNTGSELPFTGFAAIPVLLIGVFLLATGFMLNRSTRRSQL